MDVIGLGLVTAITEELVFSGYIFQKILHTNGSFWSSAILTAILFAVIHIPISIFVHNYNLVELISYLWLVVLVMMGNTWLMWKTNNVAAPILSHWLWGVAIFLFR
jgi:membrane protease YdiL (CAAX protease family)